MSTTWIPALPTDSLGARLRLLRLAKDLTVDEIAKLCDVPAPTWRTWERGARPHGLDAVVRRISQATQVDRDWLMWGEGEAEITSQERADSSVGDGFAQFDQPKAA